MGPNEGSSQVALKSFGSSVIARKNSMVTFSNFDKLVVPIKNQSQKQPGKFAFRRPSQTINLKQSPPFIANPSESTPSHMMAMTSTRSYKELDFRPLNRLTPTSQFSNTQKLGKGKSTTNSTKFVKSEKAHNFSLALTETK